jgi:hypothetical protein
MLTLLTFDLTGELRRRNITDSVKGWRPKKEGSHMSEYMDGYRYVDPPGDEDDPETDVFAIDVEANAENDRVIALVCVLTDCGGLSECSGPCGGNCGS